MVNPRLLLCSVFQLIKTRRRLELLLEDLPCEYDPWDYYETSDQLLEPLLLCYDSLVISLSPPSFPRSLPLVLLSLCGSFLNIDIQLLVFQQSCGSVVLADGRLADLIRRVATFGMVLMKLDLRQVCHMFLSIAAICFVICFNCIL